MTFCIICVYNINKLKLDQRVPSTSKKEIVMKKTLGILLILPFLVWGGVRLWKAEITFKVEAGGYMLNAANANTVELARTQMEAVVKYIEHHRLRPGFTSVIYNTPDEDVGFWMSNMKLSLDELKQISPNATSLEKSNVLIKLRETLTHKTKDGGEISVPAGISIYPYNLAFMIWGVLSFILGVVGAITFAVGLEDD